MSPLHRKEKWNSSKYLPRFGLQPGLEKSSTKMKSGLPMYPVKLKNKCYFKVTVNFKSSKMYQKSKVTVIGFGLSFTCKKEMEKIFRGPVWLFWEERVKFISVEK